MTPRIITRLLLATTFAVATLICETSAREATERPAPSGRTDDGRPVPADAQARLPAEINALQEAVIQSLRDTNRL